MPIREFNLASDLANKINAGLGGSIFGKTFYVDSGATNAGDTTNHGTSPDFPFATLDYAVGRCTAGAGDVILVNAGHAETITTASGVDVDVAGVHIIGLGVGDARPTFTFGTLAAASFELNADNLYVANLRFVNDIDAQDNCVVVNACDGLLFENCEFINGDNANKQANIFLNLNSASANSVVVRNCRFWAGTVAGAQHAIEIGAAMNLLTIEDCFVFGDFANACIYNPTSNVATNILIKDNILTNVQSGDHAIELVSACTGVIVNNVVNSTLAAVATKTAIDPGSCYCINNYGSDGVGDVSGVLNPAADA